jgi:O-antigen/teichoic acid export membrane protein
LNKNKELVDLYHSISQGLAVVLIPAAALIAVFGKEVLYVWTGDAHVSDKAAWIIAFLIVGNSCNGIMNIPYALQLAMGWTKLSFWINIWAIFILVPLTWWMALKYGAVGAAVIWAALNIAYLIITPQIMHRKVLHKEKLEWYWRGVILPIILCGVIFSLFKLMPLTLDSRMRLFATLMAYYLIALIIIAFALPKLRTKIINFMS